MEKRNFIWLNGDFFDETQPVLGISNRAFTYGDGLFETIHAYGTEGKYLDLHFQRLTRSMKLLDLKIPQYFTKEFLEKEISRLLNKNRFYQSTRIRLSVFRNEGGYYSPNTQTVSISMQPTPIVPNFYPINQKGLVVDIYTENKKPINMLSSIKSCNALLYVLAGIHKDKARVDDCLLLNEKNRIVEAISSNLFVVVGNQIYTPGLSEGCIPGIMREVVIHIATDLGYQVFNKAQIDADILTKADELFLTNSVSGIKWIVGLRHKRYYGNVSRKISEHLNNITFPDQFKDGFSG